jgi:hypothetical protein
MLQCKTGQPNQFTMRSCASTASNPTLSPPLKVSCRSTSRFQGSRFSDQSAGIGAVSSSRQSHKAGHVPGCTDSVIQLSILSSASSNTNRRGVRDLPDNSAVIERNSRKSQVYNAVKNSRPGRQTVVPSHAGVTSAETSKNDVGGTGTVIVWLKKDLRVDDHPGLAESLSARQALPVYVFDIALVRAIMHAYTRQSGCPLLSP